MPMLNELRRYNSIGNKDGILFFVRMVSAGGSISYKEALNRCALEKKITVNCNGMIAFMEFLGYLKCDGEIIDVMDSFHELMGKDDNSIIKALTAQSIKTLTDDGVFDDGCLFFNEETGHLRIKKSSFPLAFAAIRNFLISAGAFDDDRGDSIGVDGEVEKRLAVVIREHRKKITLDQLRQKQEEQNERGLKAEEFVEAYERRRLPSKAESIKRISDIDVTAGYDIISFSSDSSEQYDRFIEVKSYVGSEHFFWSENEFDVAKIKGDRYVLCLVNFERINEEGYEPLFIIDPYKEIFSGKSWLVNTASYRIERV